MTQAIATHWNPITPSNPPAQITRRGVLAGLGGLSFCIAVGSADFGNG